jgi:catecholate siderophore receptor
MLLKRKPLTAAVLMVLAMPATYAAETTEPGTTGDEKTLNEIDVRAGRAQDEYSPGVTTVGGKGGAAAVRDVPQSLSVINRAVLDAQGAATLKDALRNVPGITLSAGEGGNIGDNINIRGYSARTDLFLDGARDRGQYTRDVFFLESVEVLKGPSSMLFGRGSTGGVINQVSKQADLRDRSEASVAIGTEAFYRATADVNQKMSETSAFRVAAMGQTNESTRDVIEGERYGVAPSLRFGIGTPTEVSVSVLHQRSNEIPDYGLPIAAGGTKENPAKPIAVDRDNFYGFTDDYFNQDVDALSLRIEHKFSPALSLRNQTMYNQVEVHARPTTITSAGVRAPRDRDVKDQSLYNQTDLVAKFDTAGLKHTLVTGVEVGREYYENQGYAWTTVPPQSLTNPTYGPMPSSAIRTKNAKPSETDADSLAVYVNDTLELTNQWKLIGGLRWDQFAADVLSFSATTGIQTATSRTDEMTSVRAGVLYQPDNAQSYYVSYGTSFNPSAEQLTSLSVANAAVDPEENRSFEVGAKWDLLGGKLALNTALFRIEKDNARTTDNVTQTVTLDGNTRVDGFEIGAAGQLTSNWQIFAGYTYLNGEILKLTEGGSSGGTRDGNTLANTPEHSASLWTTVGFAKGWEAGGGLVYSAERFTNNANTAIVDGYTRFDATLAYRQKKYDVRLNVLNVTDEEYFDVASGSRATPAQGRGAIVTGTYRL